MQLTLKIIQDALRLKPPQFNPEVAHRKLAPSIRRAERDPTLPGEPRYAATLLLLYPERESQELQFVLTKRPDTLSSHGGQISFPGGRRDDGETYEQTALRETCEELGICETVNVIGQLTRIYIPPSDFYVSPFVAYCESHPKWVRNPQEVEKVIETPMQAIFDEKNKGWAEGNFQGTAYRYGYYNIDGHQVWGATAIMLSEFEWRIRAVLSL